MLILSGCEKKVQHLKVGAKAFTEQAILGEIIAQHLEKRLGPVVDRVPPLPSTQLAHQSLLTGDIDLYAEYTGAALAIVFKVPQTNDAGISFERARSEYARVQVDLFDPLGIDSRPVMVVRRQEAESKKLDSLSAAAAQPEAWRLAVSYEFQDRLDGMPALGRVYNLKSRGVARSMELAQLYPALETNQADMAAGTATDGALAGGAFVPLADDKQAFAPHQAAIAARQDALARFPALKAALAELTGKLTDTRMRELNRAVETGKTPAPAAAAEFLKSAGL